MHLPTQWYTILTTHDHRTISNKKFHDEIKKITPRHAKWVEKQHVNLVRYRDFLALQMPSDLLKHDTLAIISRRAIQRESFALIWRQRESRKGYNQRVVCYVERLWRFASGNSRTRCVAVVVRTA